MSETSRVRSFRDRVSTYLSEVISAEGNEQWEMHGWLRIIHGPCPRKAVSTVSTYAGHPDGNVYSPAQPL